MNLNYHISHYGPIPLTTGLAAKAGGPFMEDTTMITTKEVNKAELGALAALFAINSSCDGKITKRAVRDMGYVQKQAVAGACAMFEKVQPLRKRSRQLQAKQLDLAARFNRASKRFDVKYQQELQKDLQAVNDERAQVEKELAAAEAELRTERRLLDKLNRVIEAA